MAGNLYKILRKFSRSIKPLGITVILFWSPEYLGYDNKTRFTVVYWTGKIMLWMAVSAEIHAIHHDEALWIQQFVMHIICKGCDLLESWMNAKLLLLCSTDVVRTQFTFCCYPGSQYICASLKSYTNKTKLMPKFTQATKKLSSSWQI